MGFFDSLLSSFSGTTKPTTTLPSPYVTSTMPKPAIPTMSSLQGVYPTPTAPAPTGGFPGMTYTAPKPLGPTSNVGLPGMTYTPPKTPTPLSPGPYLSTPVPKPAIPTMASLQTPVAPPLTPSPTTSGGQYINPATGGVSQTPYSAPAQPNLNQYQPPTPSTQGMPQPPTSPMASSMGVKPPVPQLPTGPSKEELDYQKSLSMTPEEIAAQEQLDNLQQSENLGLNKIRDQAIPMDFITGQSASLQRQALALQEPLNQKLARLQAQRMATMGASKFALERADKAAEAAAAAKAGNKPIEIGGNLVQFNPETGKYESVYQGAQDASDVKVIGSDSTGYYERQADGSYKQVVGPGGGAGVKGVEVGGKLINPITGEEIYGGGTAEGNALKTNALQSAKDLLSKFAVNKFAVGGSSIFPALPGTQGADFNVQFNNLKSMLSLDNAKLLKGSGAISDAERQLLAQASAKLDRSQSEAEFENSLNDIIKSLSGPGEQPGGSTYGTLNGQEYELRPDGLIYPKARSGSGAASTTSGQSLGSLSSKYESGGNPGVIGYDRTGGYSYGTYQLAHNNADKFVQQSPYASQFRGLTFNSPQYRNRWQEVAKKDPNGFAKAQHDYIQKTHYQPQINKLANAGINVNKLSPAIKDVIWSTGVQHGAANNIITQAFKSAGPQATEAQIIKKIYELRWNGGRNFGSSTAAVRNSVYNRFFGRDGELNRALAMIQSSRNMA